MCQVISESDPCSQMKSKFYNKLISFSSVCLTNFEVEIKYLYKLCRC